MSLLYAGIDLHSNNNYIGIIDSNDEKVFKHKYSNDAALVIEGLFPFKDKLQGVVIESTYNWYWLVDALMESGYSVHLAHPAANQQYKGLKFSDDQRDAFWLAHLFRLGLLREGYIYPKEERPIRDLLRKRGQLVRQRTTHILSFQNLYSRNTGKQMKGHQVKSLKLEDFTQWQLEEDLILAMSSNLFLTKQLSQQIKILEKQVFSKCQLKEEFELLKTVNGIGNILALTIMLETGNIERFDNVGNYVSYCRCVSSQRFSNGKKKGQGNAKNGNKYLNWAFVEAATCAIQFNEKANRFYHRKKSKMNGTVAKKALAHKLARACYFIMRDQVSFDEEKLFAA